MGLTFQPIESDDGSESDLYKPKRSVRINIILLIILLVSIVLATVYLSGLPSILKEESFSNFTFPLEIANFKALVSAIDEHCREQSVSLLNQTIFLEILKVLSNKGFDTKAVRPYRQFSQIEVNTDLAFEDSKSWIVVDVEKPDEETGSIRLTIVVKSAVNYHNKRDSIRSSWRLNERKGFYKINTVFIVGNCDETNPVPKSLRAKLNGTEWSPQMCQDYIVREASKYNDIIQSTGIDTYHNNTIKTIMTHKWLYEQQNSDFIVAIDDDYAFEIDNLIGYLEGQASRGYNRSSLKSQASLNNVTAIISSILPGDMLLALKKLSEEYLYAGFLHYLHRPLRFPTSKFYMPTSDYSFDRYPPFVTGGLVLMSAKFSRHLYLASFLVRAFKFDDVYVGIIAYKLAVEALHDDNFMCNQADYLASRPFKQNSTSCIGVHDIAPSDLVDIWAHKRQLA